MSDQDRAALVQRLRVFAHKLAMYQDTYEAECALIDEAADALAAPAPEAAPGMCRTGHPHFCANCGAKWPESRP